MSPHLLLSQFKKHHCISQCNPMRCPEPSDPPHPPTQEICSPNLRWSQSQGRRVFSHGVGCPLGFSGSSPPGFQYTRGYSQWRAQGAPACGMNGWQPIYILYIHGLLPTHLSKDGGDRGRIIRLASQPNVSSIQRPHPWLPNAMNCSSKKITVVLLTAITTDTVTGNQHHRFGRIQKTMHK